jgi:hypothetical protein
MTTLLAIDHNGYQVLTYWVGTCAAVFAMCRTILVEKRRTRSRLQRRTVIKRVVPKRVPKNPFGPQGPRRYKVITQAPNKHPEDPGRTLWWS